MKYCLRLSKIVWVLLMFCSCAKSPYTVLNPCEQCPTIDEFQPQIDKKLYRCIVDGKSIFKTYHLSGILIFKTMGDGSLRTVFQNEMGLNFFDFEWSPSMDFKVISIMPQLDKAALIQTLRKDFEILMGQKMNQKSGTEFRAKNNMAVVFGRGEGTVAYIKSSGKSRIENWGKRKKVITISSEKNWDFKALPSQLLIVHHRANFKIDLSEFIQNESQE